MDWIIIINFVVSAKISSSISIEDLKKACICISDFGILKAESNKISASNVNNTIPKAFHNNPDFKSTSSNSNKNILSNETKKDSENTKLKLVEKKPICKLFT